MNALAGRTLWITRAREDAEPWAERIRARGGTPAFLPCLRCETLRDAATKDALLRACRGADWLLVTSAHAAAAVAELLPGPRSAVPRVAAVGARTAAAASRTLGRCDHVGTGGVAELAVSLCRELARERAAARIVHASSDRARTDGDAVFARNGVLVERVPVYRTIPYPAAADPSRAGAESFPAGGEPLVLFASPSAVEGFQNRGLALHGVRSVTAGPTTSAAVRAAGGTVHAEAARPDIDSLLEALHDFLTASPG